MARRHADPGLRARYIEKMRRLDEVYGTNFPDTPWGARREHLEAGGTIVVEGWELGPGNDLPLYGQHYVLESNGSVTPCEPVFVKGARVRTVRGYVRPDGSWVQACGRDHDSDDDGSPVA